MSDILVQGPLAEPVSLEEAKGQLRFTSSNEDAFIKALIKSARARIENREATSQVYVRQSRRMVLDRFPLCNKAIEIVKVPLRAIESITYVDVDGNTQTWDSDEYETGIATRFPIVRPKEGFSYPSTKDVLGAVSVNYSVGHMVPFTVDIGTDVITAKGHDLSDDAVVQLRNSGGALPAGLAEEINYFVITATTDTLKLSLTEGGGAIDLTAVGTGLNFIGVGEGDLNTALLLIIDDQFTNRSENVTGTIVSGVPNAVANLCAQHALVRR